MKHHWDVKYQRYSFGTLSKLSNKIQINVREEMEMNYKVYKNNWKVSKSLMKIQCNSPSEVGYRNDTFRTTTSKSTIKFLTFSKEGVLYSTWVPQYEIRRRNCEKVFPTTWLIDYIFIWTLLYKIIVKTLTMGILVQLWRLY